MSRDRQRSRVFLHSGKQGFTLIEILIVISIISLLASFVMMPLVALVLAKVFTKTTEVIALRHSYSGRTLVAMTNTAHSKYRALPA